MRSLTNWIQLLTAIAVIAGLGLVIYELRQTRELAVMQISSDGWLSSQQLDSILVGEDLAGTMARIAIAESRLTRDDLYRYDGYAFARITSIRRNVWLAKNGFYDTDWEAFMGQTTACYFFGSDVGQAYLKSPAVGEDDVVRSLIENSKNCSRSDSYLHFMANELGEKRVER